MRHDEQTAHRTVALISSDGVYGSKPGLNLTSRLLRLHGQHIYTYILYFSCRKHVLRKTAYLPNQTCDSPALYLRRKLTFTVIVWYYNAFNPENASETNATNSTPPTKKTSKFSRHRCCLTLNSGNNVSHLHSDRCQPLTTVKHEQRKVVLRVRAAE